MFDEIINAVYVPLVYRGISDYTRRVDMDVLGKLGIDEYALSPQDREDALDIDSGAVRETV